MHLFENLLHVRGKVERLRKDDEIELASEFQILARHGMEFSVRQPRARRGDLAFREIDAHDISIRQQFEQVAAAAADFQDARFRRNQIPIIDGQ